MSMIHVMAEATLYGPPPTDHQIERASVFLDYIPASLRTRPGRLSTQLSSRQAEMLGYMMRHQGEKLTAVKEAGVTEGTFDNYLSFANKELGTFVVDQAIVVAEHHGYIAPFDTYNITAVATRPPTEAQLVVMQGLAFILNTSAIARILDVPERTVTAHIPRAYKRVGCPSHRSALIAWGVQNDYILTARRFLGHEGKYC